MKGWILIQPFFYWHGHYLLSYSIKEAMYGKLYESLISCLNLLLVCLKKDYYNIMITKQSKRTKFTGV